MTVRSGNEIVREELRRLSGVLEQMRAQYGNPDWSAGELLEGMQDIADQLDALSRCLREPASHSGPMGEEDRRLIGTAALHLSTWATSKNKDPYANTLDVAQRLEAMLKRTAATQQPFLCLGEGLTVRCPSQCADCATEQAKNER
jgi:hypothetical protein